MNAADLFHLIDRAECGSLLAEEAQHLRDGVRALDAARRSAGGLQRSLHSARAERDQLRADLDRVQQAACRTAESLRVAEDQRDRIRTQLLKVLADSNRIGYPRPHLERQLSAAIDQPQQPTTTTEA